MSSRGSSPRRNRGKETKKFIEAVKSDTSISDLTKNELVKRAQQSLDTFRSASSPGGGKADSFTALTFAGDFDKTAKGLRKELDAAREGRAPKFRFRQFQQKKRELLQDRPGQSQLIRSR